jgi:hypothetical protein
LSLNNKKQNVEVVLPPSGAGIDSGTKQNTKNQKQILKNKINELKQQQKETAGTIRATQKELNKLSKPTVNKTAANKKLSAPSKNKKDVKVVKKGRNKLNGKK